MFLNDQNKRQQTEPIILLCNQNQTKIVLLRHDSAPARRQARTMTADEWNCRNATDSTHFMVVIRNLKKPNELIKERVDFRSLEELRLISHRK